MSNKDNNNIEIYNAHNVC